MKPFSSKPLILLMFCINKSKMARLLMLMALFIVDPINGLAPFSIKYLTMSTFRQLTARPRAVKPFLSIWLMSSPFSIHCLTVVRSPFETALKSCPFWNDFCKSGIIRLSLFILAISMESWPSPSFWWIIFWP